MNLELSLHCVCYCRTFEWQLLNMLCKHLTHSGRVTHICASKQSINASDNGLSPSRRQAIIVTNAGILLIRTLGTNFSEIFSEILTFSFKKMCLKVSSAKWRPFCLGLNVLKVSVKICWSFWSWSQNIPRDLGHSVCCWYPGPWFNILNQSLALPGYPKPWYWQCSINWLCFY